MKTFMRLYTFLALCYSDFRNTDTQTAFLTDRKEGPALAEKVSTSTLMKRLFRTRHLDMFLARNEQNMQAMDFSESVSRLCAERGLVPEQVILRSEIDRTYGHQLFTGVRRPSRDKVIQLALGLGLDIEETQKLLRSAGKSELYPRLKREAVILFCIREKMTVLETQEMLTRYGFTLLGDAR